MTESPSPAGGGSAGPSGPPQPPATSASRPRAFETTWWTLVRAAGETASPDNRAALETLCRRYYYPLYAYVRRTGCDAELASDRTQGFFHHLLKSEALKRADPEVGKFRTFLLSSLKNFLANCHRDESRLKRGGGIAPLRLEWDEAERRYSHEPADEGSPDAAFDRNWARSLMNTAVLRLREEYRERGEGERFEALQAGLQDPGGVDPEMAGPRLGLSPAGIRTAVHRLRTRFRAVFRGVVAESLEDPMAVDEEVNYLFHALVG